MSPKLYVELSAAAWPASDSKNMRGNTYTYLLAGPTLRIAVGPNV